MARTINELPLKATLASADNIIGIDTAGNKAARFSPTAVRLSVLNNKTVGGTSTGDIADIDTTQTLLKKRLNAPRINSNAEINATGEEINKLAGLTTTQAELQKLSGVTVGKNELNRLIGLNMNVQEALLNVMYFYPRTFNCGIQFTLPLGDTATVIDGADMVAKVGLLPEEYVVDHTSITMCIDKANAEDLTWDTIYPTVSKTYDTAFGVNYLDEIRLSGLSKGSHNAALSFTVFRRPQQ